MKKMNVWKRTLAGLMALLIVAGYSCPAEIGLFEGIPVEIAAHAENEPQTSQGLNYITHTADKSWIYATIDNYTIVNQDTTSWTNGTYVVEKNAKVVIENLITVNGSVKLILCDGATLSAKKGIRVNSGNTLEIFAQSDENAGKLYAGTTPSDGSSLSSFIPEDDQYAAIGGAASTQSGNIIIHGGTITAVAKKGAPGIGGGGQSGTLSTLTIFGGDVTATVEDRGYSSGIGGGYNASNNGTVNIYGGKLTVYNQTANNPASLPATWNIREGATISGTPSQGNTYIIDAGTVPQSAGWNVEFAPDYTISYGDASIPSTEYISTDNSTETGVTATFKPGTVHFRSEDNNRPAGYCWVGAKLTAPETAEKLEYKNQNDEWVNADDRTAAEITDEVTPYSYFWIAYNEKNVLDALTTGNGYITKSFQLKTAENKEFTYVVKIDVRNIKMLGVDNDDTPILTATNGNLNYCLVKDFDALQKAVNANGTETEIKLGADIQFREPQTELTISKNKKITIDGQKDEESNYQIRGLERIEPYQGSETSSSTFCGIHILGSAGNVTIKNVDLRNFGSSHGDTGNDTGNESQTVKTDFCPVFAEISRDHSLTMENVKIREFQKEAVRIGGIGEATLNRCTIEGDSHEDGSYQSGMVSFIFNPKNEPGVKLIRIGDKTLYEAIV